VNKPDIRLLEAMYQMRGGVYQEYLRARLLKTDEGLRQVMDTVNLRRLQGVAGVLVELIDEIDKASEKYSEANARERSSANADRSSLKF
jgi:hypothetical protein